jgi:hypothetical protein
MRATCRIKNNMADQNHEHACANFPVQARLSFARRTREFFVTNDEKYQTCLTFGLHVTNDENAVNVARTRGNFVDPTCHK